MFQKRRMSSNQGDSLRKYDTITLENRKTLVRLVVEEERSISKCAKRLGIKLSTAKLIIKKYKESGSFFEKKRDRESRERAEQKLSEQNGNDIQGQMNNALPLGPADNFHSSFPLALAQPYPMVNIVEPNFYIYNCLPQQMYWL